MVNTIAAEYKKLEQKCLKLEKCFSNLILMEKKLEEQQELAKTDPEISKKLQRMQQQYYPAGFSQLKGAFVKEVQQLSMTLRQLEAKIKRISIEQQQENKKNKD